MRLRYASVGAKPIILALIEDIATGVRTLFPMLMDTGADETCFPASYAAHFGHNNLAHGVRVKHIHGVGGQSLAYIHSVRLVLIEPRRSTKNHFVPAWSSSLGKAAFISRLTMPMGLLGRDVMQEWKEARFIRTPRRQASKWDILIRI